jgi:hypothetical protein
VGQVDPLVHDLLRLLLQAAEIAAVLVEIIPHNIGWGAESRICPDDSAHGRRVPVRPRIKDGDAIAVVVRDVQHWKTGRAEGQWASTQPQRRRTKRVWSWH